MVNIERLKELLIYNHETGVFTWRIAAGRRVKAGDVAGNFTNDYIRIVIDGKKYRAHRLAWFYSYGAWPNNMVDHRNGVTTDNRLLNLREATRSQNAHNRRTNVNSSTGVKGVVLCRTSGLYKARIMVDSIEYSLGLFASKKEAETVVRKHREKLHGEFLSHG